MKTLLACLIFVPFLALRTEAQPVDIVPDSLDWHRYFPLHVGDVWEYQVSEGEPLLVHRILDDSVTVDHHYFLMERQSWNFDYIGGGDELEIWSMDTLFVRYSDNGGLFRLNSPEADTLSTPRDMQFWNGMVGHYDLRTAFGDRVFYSTGPEDFYWTSGGYQETVGIGGITYTPDAVKNFSGGVMWETYATDIGLISSMNLWGPWLTYAIVDGKEYGQSRIPTSVEDEFARDEFPIDPVFIESIYPNPATDRITIRFRTSAPTKTTLAMYDLLGKMVWSDEQLWRPAGFFTLQVPVTNLASGVYYMRLFSDSGAHVVRPVSIIR